MSREGKYRKPDADILGFMGLFKPAMKALGMVFKAHDTRWLNAGGADPDAYKARTEGDPRTDQVWREYNARGTCLAEIIQGELRVKLFVAGPRDSAMHFEMRDSKERVERMDHIGPETIDAMVDRLQEIVAGDLKRAMRLKKDLHLQ